MKYFFLYLQREGFLLNVKKENEKLNEFFRGLKIILTTDDRYFPNPIGFKLRLLLSASLLYISKNEDKQKHHTGK
jgi:hypothetical protein